MEFLLTCCPALSPARQTIAVRTHKPIEVTDILTVTDDGCFEAVYSVPSGPWSNEDIDRMRSVINYAYSASPRMKFSKPTNKSIKPMTYSNWSELMNDRHFIRW